MIGVREGWTPLVMGGRRLVHHGLVLLLLAVAVWRGVVALAALAQRWQGVSGAVGDWRWAVLAAAVISFLGAAGALGQRLRLWLEGRWQTASLAPLRLLVYCLVAGWLSYLAFFGSYIPIAFVWMSGVTLGAWGLLLLAAPVLRRVLPRRAVTAVDVAVLYVIVLVVAGEIGLRLLSEVRPSVLLLRSSDGVERAVAAGRYPPGTVRYGFQVNSGGDYDEEFVPKRPGETLVVTIGDSFSAGVVPHYFHFTTVAERYLKGTVTIDNMGVPSIDPPEYLYLLLHEALPLHPDAVVIDLFMGNDLSYRLPSSGDSLVRAWLDRQNVLLLQVPRRLLRLVREGEGVRHGPAGERVDDSGATLDTPEEIARSFPWVVDPLLEEGTFKDQVHLAIERERFHELEELDAEGIARRLEPLLTMRRAARGIPFGVMVIPDELQLNDELWKAMGVQSATQGDRLASLDLTRRWLEAHGFPYLDLYPILRAVPPLSDGRRHLYHLRDTHFNARGNAVAGEALASFVARLLRLPEPATSGGAASPAP